MPLWAIVPIKSLHRGKSRLAGLLTADERESLNQNLLVHTLRCLQDIPEIDEIAVISHDPSALHIAREMGAKTIQEGRDTDINNALRKATEAVKASNGTKLLIIPADLPLIQPEDISNLLSKAKGKDEIIISPDKKMGGTNALYINPIGILDYDFGLWSFNKHIEQAERKKIRVEIYNNERIAFDLDLPEDLEYIRENKILDKIFTELN